MDGILGGWFHRKGAVKLLVVHQNEAEGKAWGVDLLPVVDEDEGLARGGRGKRGGCTSCRFWTRVARGGPGASGAASPPP